MTGGIGELQTASKQLQAASRELTRIGNLPTEKEFLKKEREKFELDLRKARRVSEDPRVGVRALETEQQRKLFKLIQQGKSDRNIISQVEFDLKRTLSPVERRDIIAATKGITTIGPRGEKIIVKDVPAQVLAGFKFPITISSDLSLNFLNFSGANSSKPS